MKNIQNYYAAKYDNEQEYRKVEEDIYQYTEDGEELYVTSLSFEQEPEYGEGESAADISQYPLEDILDEYLCHISDFYEEFNVEESKTCFIEFASPEIQDIRNLRGIIGKEIRE